MAVVQCIKSCTYQELQLVLISDIIMVEICDLSGKVAGARCLCLRIQGISRRKKNIQWTDKSMSNIWQEVTQISTRYNHGEQKSIRMHKNSQPRTGNYRLLQRATETFQLENEENITNAFCSGEGLRS